MITNNTIAAFRKAATDRLMHEDGCPEGEQIRAGLKAVAPMIAKAAYEEARKAVSDAGWYQANPDVRWDIVDTQIDHSESAIIDLIQALSVKP